MNLSDLAKVMYYPKCVPIYRLSNKDCFSSGNSIDAHFFIKYMGTVGEYFKFFEMLIDDRKDNFLKYEVKFLVKKEKK